MNLNVERCRLFPGRMVSSLGVSEKHTFPPNVNRNTSAGISDSETVLDVNIFPFLWFSKHTY
jgi:hypothetical protein